MGVLPLRDFTKAIQGMVQSAILLLEGKEDAVLRDFHNLDLVHFAMLVRQRVGKLGKVRVTAIFKAQMRYCPVQV